MEDGIVESRTIFNTYGDKQPNTISYSVFNGKLSLVISEKELIDKNEFDKLTADRILKVCSPADCYVMT